MEHNNEISRATVAQRLRRDRERYERERIIDESSNNASVETNSISRRSIAQRERRDRERFFRRSSFCTGESSNSSSRRRITVNPQLSNISNIRSVAMEASTICHRNLSHQSRLHTLPVRHSLGTMNIICPYCYAFHWMDEKLSNSSTSRPLFGTCCLQGKIRLPLLRTPPLPIKALYDHNDEQSKSFRSNIRQYNAANAFTSIGAIFDERYITGRGPKTFIIHGELRHLTGSLIPEPGEVPVYSQLYIYDSDSAFNARCTRNGDLRVDVLKCIQETLLQCNPFIHIYRQAYAILSNSGEDGENLSAVLHYSPNTDRRRYNLPSANEIAVIIPGDGTTISGMRDIILHFRNTNGLQRINECHPAYLPLHYVLFFPYGELGWEPEFKQWDIIRGQYTNIRLSQLDFYRYRIFEHSNEYSAIIRGGKLFQQFLVDAWAATEQNRLNFYKLNQGRLRSELYSGLTDEAIVDIDSHNIGRRIILPSSFIGSPRHRFEIFQDSMAITRFNHHPDVFLTMTANPNWHEIISALLPHQKPHDRPDLIARVFELKRIALMKEIQIIFGKKIAHVFTIEYQKRGLPHMHVLLFLDGPDKIRTCSQVDAIISANFPDPIQDPELFDTVRKCMVHGPCGPRNPRAPCMENGRCTKRYPRDFTDETTMDRDGYPIYRRYNDGKKYIVKGQEVDNRDVVPYNPHLSRMFDCHINVEVCAGLRCCKYIHKYIYKGEDRATMVLGEDNEIKQYVDARYIGPSEAARRLFSFPLHEEVPAVIRLAVHLPGMHHVVFNPNEPLDSIIHRAEGELTTLTAYFICCASDENARQLTYQEFPQYFVWHQTQRIWTPRQRGFAIGRMYFVSPNSGERFYLRLLLTVVRGARSFECLRTINGILYETFKEACVAAGLLEDDNEWIQCLQEASIMSTGYKLRRLFAIILMECSPVNPDTLWDTFSMHICDDLSFKISTLFAISSPSEVEVNDYGLFLINQMLEEYGRSLSDFPPMPLPVNNWSTVVGNRLIWEHKELQCIARASNFQDNIDCLNVAQRSAYELIIASVFCNKGTIFFVNGGAGTGKTFLYNSISTACRANDFFVVTVASSGIASLLLEGGRTAHSTFRIPLDVMENSVCGFSKQSLHAELFRQTRLIIWDEVPMQHKFCVESVDRTLQDICNNAKPFGGITVVFGGDFRQILPVIPKGLRQEIITASLRRSFLWSQIHVLNLEVNMRLISSNVENAEFAQYLLQIGSNPNESVELPIGIRKCTSVYNLIDTVYPELHILGIATPSYLTDRTILCARNDDVAYINLIALDKFPTEKISYLAADKISEDNVPDRQITNRYPNEFLNSLNPSGLPPFNLTLKIGCPIMLLRNIAPSDGLCNGTRLMVVRCAPHIIEAKILTGSKSGNLAFIPRISLSPSSSEFPFQMTRRQFPVRLAFCMTINKSQGQSVNTVGVDLRSPVFSHGQLYVALSRCTSFKEVSVLLPNTEITSTTNIVYPEVLLS